MTDNQTLNDEYMERFNKAMDKIKRTIELEFETLFETGTSKQIITLYIHYYHRMDLGITPELKTILCNRNDATLLREVSNKIDIDWEDAHVYTLTAVLQGHVNSLVFLLDKWDFLDTDEYLKSDTISSEVKYVIKLYDAYGWSQCGKNREYMTWKDYYEKHSKIKT
jgi:hypothetical protein